MRVSVFPRERDVDAINYVDTLLRGAGLPMDDVKAQTLSVKICDIECIDGVVMRMEARRNSVFREIERCRARFGTALRKSVEEIEDGEFTEIGSSRIEASGARRARARFALIEQTRSAPAGTAQTERLVLAKRAEARS